MTKLHSAFIGVGSNMNSPIDQCREAIEQLAAHTEIDVIARSAFYETEPVDNTDQDWFINAVLKISTPLQPEPLLKALLKIENDMGRVRNKRWEPRIIDLDILLFEDRVIKNQNLTVPHPEMSRRRFALEPLTELDAEAVHPVLKKTARELLSDLPPFPEVKKLAGSG